jgi:hypothetical protein
MTDTNATTCIETTSAPGPTNDRAHDDFIGGPIRSRPSRSDPAWATNEQADGFWANVVRAYEDGLCN